MQNGLFLCPGIFNTTVHWNFIGAHALGKAPFLNVLFPWALGMGVVKACQIGLGHFFLPHLPGGVRACQDGLDSQLPSLISLFIFV